MLIDNIMNLIYEMTQVVAMRKQGTANFTLNSIKAIPKALPVNNINNAVSTAKKMAAPITKDAISAGLPVVGGHVADSVGMAGTLKDGVSSAWSAKENIGSVKDAKTANNTVDKLKHLVAGTVSNAVPLGNTAKAGFDHGAAYNVDSESMKQIEKIKQKYPDAINNRHFIASIKEREICRRNPSLCQTQS